MVRRRIEQTALQRGAKKDAHQQQDDEQKQQRILDYHFHRVHLLIDLKLPVSGEVRD